MKIAILGFGREGKSLLKFLRKSKIYRNTKLVICDRNPNLQIHTNATNIKARLGKDWLKNLSDFDTVFRSPGVPYNLPEIQKALKHGVKFSSATKLFFDIVTPRLRSGSIVGVTGTKGKGTTSTLIYKILKASGKKVLLAGNIGKSPLEILPKVTKDTLVILELSSFQLQDLQKSPKIAVLTEIFPDHQDVHKNMAEYLDAKANIARHQKKSDVVFYFKNNLPSRGIAEKSPGKKIAVSAPDTLEKNRILAAAVARHLGCPEKIIEKTAKNFRGLEHRLELVRIMRTRRPTQNKRGQTRKKFRASPLDNPRELAIWWYNDSASTNPQTTAAAILSFKEPLILIAGGRDKNLDYAPLAKAIKKSGNVKEVILIGENKKKIYQEIRNEKLEIRIAGDLNSAIQMAYKKAKYLSNQVTNLLINIVFSPGAASFDMFKNYADRGEKFKKFVLHLK